MRVETPAASANSVNASEQAKTGAEGVQVAALDVANAAAQAKAPVAIQANAIRVTPGPDGTVTLPEGVSLEQIAVAGRDLVIQLPNGEQIIIEDGAVYVPQLVIGGVEIPAVNLAALLIGNEPQPAAGGPQSSGGNFAVEVGDIGPGIGIGNLLPPTALEFTPPEFEEVYPAVEDDEPSVIIFPDDQPGAPNVTQTTSDAGLPGGSDEGSGSNQTSGTITFHSGDTPATVTINGVHAAPGAIIPSEHGYLEIISVNNGNSPDGFVEYIFVQTENVLHPPGSNDVFEEIFEVVVTDADGDVATGSLTINILDDFPEAHADADSVAEHGPTVANGNVMTGVGGNDANNTDGVADFQGADDDVMVTGVVAGSVSSASGSVGTTVQGQYGTLVINANGSYTYTLNSEHSAVNALDSGETLSDVFTYTITDADADTSSTQLTITINGANDAPVANPDTNWVLDVTSAPTATTTGNVLQSINHPGAPSGSFADQADTDVDVETLTVTTTGPFPGTYGTLQLNADGSYTYTLNANNAAVNALDTGETLTETFNYTASDGTASANATLTITIFGTNDAPVANADTNWAQEDVAQQASGNVLDTINHPGAPSGTFGDVADTDVDVENLTVTTTGSFTGTYGTLQLNADGSYTYTLNNGNAAVQALDDGETLTDTFNYTASDGTTTASSTLTVTIFGNNDAPVANPDTNWVLDVVEGADPTTTGNVLQTLAHNGAPSGTFGDVADTDVDVENLTVTTTGSFPGTYGTLVLNADGTYTYTLNANHAAVNALDTGETLTDSFNYTASDGTASANSTLTITIFGTNDAPVVGTGSAQVSEEGLATGNPDTTGSPDTTNSASDLDGQLSITDVDDSSFTVTLGLPTAELTSNNVEIEWSLLDSQTLVGKAGTTEVVRVTIDNLGNYDVVLKGQIDHPDGSVEDQVMFDVPVAVSDGEATTNSSISVITVEDDSPIDFTPGSTPVSGSLSNAPGSTATYNLDADGDVNNNMGADQGGTITFDVVDGQDSPHTSSGDLIEYWVSDDGQTLEARTNSTDGTDGDLIYTVTLNQAGGTYTVTMYDTIDNGSGVAFNDLSGGTAGNPPFKIVESTTADALELLFTPIGTNTVNSDSDDIAAGGQFLVFDDGLRIDFGDFTFHANGGGTSDDGFTINDHTPVNGFRFTIDQVSSGTVADVKLVTYDADVGSANQTINTHNFTNDTPLTITEVKVYNTAGTLVATFTGDDTQAGITADFDGTNGVILRGVPAQYSIETTASSLYDRIEITNVGTGGQDGKFSISELQIEQVDFGDPVPITVPVTLTDADGDSVDADLNFTVGTAAPPIALDLDGDGLEFVSQSAGNVFDYNGDGHAEATAWVGSDDGVLAIDNGDGMVGVTFAVNGLTDLEGLAATYDSNHDGVLSADDADFSKFGVLQNGEFTSLTDAGIVSLNLVSDGEAYTAANGQVQVFGEATFTWSDGSTGALADAAFSYTSARTSDEVQRVFGQNAGGAYANLLAAAAMITAAATGFAMADAPLLKAIDAQDFLGDITLTQNETFTTQIETNRPEITDAFDGGVKEGPAAHDTVHFSEHLSNLLADTGFEAPQANETLSTLLANTDLAPSLHDASPMLVDMTVMPMIATPLQAIAQNAPAAPELVAEVLADALSGGAQAGISIDDMLAALPSGGATMGLSHEFGGGAMVLALHPVAFHHEATLSAHIDSVTVA